MKKEKIICRDCGREIAPDELDSCTLIDGEYICEECFNENYFYCEDCGKIEFQEYGTWIEDKQIMVCSNCVNNYTYCEDCGKYYSSDTCMSYIENYGYVCEHCYNYGDYGYCDNCGYYFRYDELHYSERQDRYYCDDCYDYDDDLLYEYHEFNDWYLFRDKDETEPPYYIGKEIELEPKNCDDLQEVLNAKDRYLNAVGMHDGSLNRGGVEIVTHPESWKYLQSKKQDYKNFFDEMEHLGYGDAGNTGLHFHITRPSDDIISRIIVILESFKDEIKKLSRRNGDFGWSKFLTDTTDLEKYKYQSTKYIKEKYVKEYHDRYLALNLQNTRTIEFRFFNGANNFEEFWGALQFIHNIMEIALDETKDINNINWQDLLTGDELIAQAEKQEVLNIDKYAKDTTEIVDKIEKAKEETKETIKRTLRNFIKYLTREIESNKVSIFEKDDITKIKDNGKAFIEKLTNEISYLSTITRLYENVQVSSLNRVKDTIDYVKFDYDEKTKTYSRYFKQIDDKFKEINEIIKQIESGVYA